MELSALRRNAEVREREWQAKVRLTRHVFILAMSNAVFKNSLVNLLKELNCNRIGTIQKYDLIGSVEKQTNTVLQINVSEWILEKCGRS